MYEGIPGCRQGRNNVRLMEKHREALRQADDTFDTIASCLSGLISPMQGDDTKRNILEGLIRSCRLQVQLNQVVHEEAKNVLD